MAALGWVPVVALIITVVGAATVVKDRADDDTTGTTEQTVYNLPTIEEKWWHNAIVYQVYPRSFKDTDGDGIGDIKGITSSLPYLKELGVTAVWLSPIYKSPQADFGYDISDFVDVDPQYGTLEDLKTLISETHKLGMKLVLDFVPNHSSNEHEWFQKSEAMEKDFLNYYVWSDKGVPNPAATKETTPVPNNWVSHFRGSVWEWSEKRKAYYLHQFAKEQPDLNYNEPKVVEEIDKVYKFWMDLGVDGFRIDAVPFLFEDENLTDEPAVAEPGTATESDYEYYDHPYTHDLPATYDMVKKWRKLVDTHVTSGQEGKAADRIIMTESYTTLDKTIEYYGTKTEPGASFTFNFEAITALNAASSATDFKKTIDSWLGKMEDWRWPNWVIGNHDNKRVATRYPGMEDSMNMISLTLPGTAVTYYGEELGMADTFITWSQTKDPQALSHDSKTYLDYSRDPCRTPFQWDDTTSAGFSSNRKTWMPTNPDYGMKNIKYEVNSPGITHLKIYRSLAAARQTDPLKKGSTETSVVGDEVLKIVRSLEQSDTYITLVNIGSWEQDIETSSILRDRPLYVYVASVNSGLSLGVAPPTIVLRPKAGVVLTTAKPAETSTTSAPEPKPTTPEPKPTAPETKPTAPETKPTAPETKPTAPAPKPTAPEPKATTPNNPTSSASPLSPVGGLLVALLALLRH